MLSKLQQQIINPKQKHRKTSIKKINHKLKTTPTHQVLENKQLKAINFINGIKVMDAPNTIYQVSRIIKSLDKPKEQCQRNSSFLLKETKKFESFHNDYFYDQRNELVNLANWLDKQFEYLEQFSKGQKLKQRQLIINYGLNEIIRFQGQKIKQKGELLKKLINNLKQHYNMIIENLCRKITKIELEQINALNQVHQKYLKHLQQKFITTGQYREKIKKLQKLGIDMIKNNRYLKQHNAVIQKQYNNLRHAYNILKNRYVECQQQNLSLQFTSNLDKTWMFIRVKDIKAIKGFTYPSFPKQLQKYKKQIQLLVKKQMVEIVQGVWNKWQSSYDFDIPVVQKFQQEQQWNVFKEHVINQNVRKSKKIFHKMKSLKQMQRNTNKNYIYGIIKTVQTDTSDLQQYQQTGVGSQLEMLEKEVQTCLQVKQIGSMTDNKEDQLSIELKNLKSSVKNLQSNSVRCKSSKISQFNKNSYRWQDVEQQQKKLKLKRGLMKKVTIYRIIDNQNQEYNPNDEEVKSQDLEQTKQYSKKRRSITQCFSNRSESKEKQMQIRRMEQIPPDQKEERKKTIVSFQKNTSQKKQKHFDLNKLVKNYYSYAVKLPILNQINQIIHNAQPVFIKPKMLSKIYKTISSAIDDILKTKQVKIKNIYSHQFKLFPCQNLSTVLFQKFYHNFGLKLVAQKHFKNFINQVFTLGKENKCLLLSRLLGLTKNNTAQDLNILLKIIQKLDISRTSQKQFNLLKCKHLLLGHTNMNLIEKQMPSILYKFFSEKQCQKIMEQIREQLKDEVIDLDEIGIKIMKRFQVNVKKNKPIQFPQQYISLTFFNEFVYFLKLKSSNRIRLIQQDGLIRNFSLSCDVSDKCSNKYMTKYKFRSFAAKQHQLTYSSIQANLSSKLGQTVLVPELSIQFLKQISMEQGCNNSLRMILGGLQSLDKLYRRIDLQLFESKQILILQQYCYNMLLQYNKKL